MSVDKIKENGLLYQPRKSSRYPALHITDADFADDIALLADNLTNAQNLLSALESAANSTGLYLNETKTECMPINIRNRIEVKTLSNNILKQGCQFDTRERDHACNHASEPFFAR